MPSYCYECRKCGTEFSLIVPETQDFDCEDVECTACNDSDIVLLAFCVSDDLTLINLSARILDLERRIKELEGEDDDERLDS